MTGFSESIKDGLNTVVQAIYSDVEAGCETADEIGPMLADIALDYADIYSPGLYAEFKEYEKQVGREQSRAELLKFMEGY